MLRMDSHHSDTSLDFSDREAPAWVKLWSANYDTAGGLTLGENGSNTDLTSAIGDKEVAAKAVAFVVNSTRRGIVPLCADVANLLRAKKSLEDKILQLSKDNELLRSLNDERESLTGSSVLRSKLTTEQRDHFHSERNDSECSYHSSSPVNETQSINDHNESNNADVTPVQGEPGSTAGDQSEKRVLRNHHSSSSSNSSRGSRPSAGQLPQHGFVPVMSPGKVSSRDDRDVIIHHPIPSDDVQSNSNDNVTLAEVYVSSESKAPKQPRHRTHQVDRHRRTPSLSSSEHGSSRSLELNSGEERQSLSAMSRKLNKTMLVNNKLSEELNAARATIEKLQREVRDFRVFCKNNNHDGADAHRKSSSLNGLTTQQKFLSDREFPQRNIQLSSCHICTEAYRASSLDGGATPRLFKHDAVTLFTSENMCVSLEDSILTSDNQCGTVKFIGHLEGFAPTCLFVGLQLADKEPGGLDGAFSNKRYFNCPKGRGIFIQAQQIVNVISKKQASVFHKAKKPGAAVSIADEALTTSSSSNNGSSGGFVSKLRKAAVNIRHTHSHKRISLPGTDAAPLPIPQLKQSTANNQTTVTAEINHRHCNSVEDDLPEGFV